VQEITILQLHGNEIVRSQDAGLTPTLLTVLTGFFGINFEKMPWFKTSPWLWPSIMAMIAVGLFWSLPRLQ
jgi:hypothetical protein